MPDFIYSNFVKDKTLPERIKDYFYKNPDYHRKGAGYQIEKGLNEDKNIKDSTDICFTLDKSVNIDVVSDLLKELQVVLEEYMQKYPWCNKGDPFTINTFNIQNYKEFEKKIIYILVDDVKDNIKKPHIGSCYSYCSDVQIK